MKRTLNFVLLAAVGFAVMGADDAMAVVKNKAASAATPAPSLADVPPPVPHAGEKPLMVIRFNQATVAYEWPLYNTLTKALEVKPQALFDVVSAAPRSQDLAQQARDSENASTDLAKVLATLKEIGMPETRYTVTKIYDDVKSSEVRIYVK